MAVETDEAFFHRQETHKLIDQLSELDNLTIYVGAGASIERTGLSWGGLIAELLDPELGDYRQRSVLADALSPAFASSAAAEGYRDRYPGTWRERVAERLRSLLYRGDEERSFGIFNEKVATLVDQLNGAGKSVVVVTTNYDDFLIRDVRQIGFPVREIILGSVPEGLASTESATVELAERLKSIASGLASRDEVTIVHLHGLLTAEGSVESEKHRGLFPVVTEEDYLNTGEQSATVLEQLFLDRNVLILGASVTDPPLVRALLSTKPERAQKGGVGNPRRYVSVYTLT